MEFRIEMPKGNGEMADYLLLQVSCFDFRRCSSAKTESIVTGCIKGTSMVSTHVSQVLPRTLLATCHQRNFESAI